MAVSADYDEPPRSELVGFALGEAQRFRPGVDMEGDIAMPAANDHQSPLFDPRGGGLKPLGTQEGQSESMVRASTRRPQSLCTCDACCVGHALGSERTRDFRP